MKVTSLDEHQLEPATHEDPKNPGVLKKVLFNFRDFDPECGLRMLNYAVIQPGKAFELHHHETLEEVFYILKGTAEITVADETSQLSEGMAVLIPRHAPHVMKNTGSEPLEYLAFGGASGEGATVTHQKQ
jgi:quercetin dioxygenase-like cupin family protein